MTDTRSSPGSDEVMAAAKRMQAFNALTQLVTIPWDDIDPQERNHWIGLACVAVNHGGPARVERVETTGQLPPVPSFDAAQARPDSLISAIHDALAAADLEYSGYSCNGVNLVGDRASIKAAMAAFHSHGQRDHLATQIRHWREECGKLHAKLASSLPSTDGGTP